MSNAIVRKGRRAKISIGATILLVFLNISAAAQNLGTGEPINPPIGRLILGLLLCVVLIYVTVWTLKTLSARRSGMPFKSFLDQGMLGTNTRIKIMETKRLNQTSDACLFECDETEYLVLISQSQTVVLRERSISSDPTASKTA